MSFHDLKKEASQTVIRNQPCLEKTIRAEGNPPLQLQLKDGKDDAALRQLDADHSRSRRSRSQRERRRKQKANLLLEKRKRLEHRMQRKIADTAGNQVAT